MRRHAQEHGQPILRLAKCDFQLLHAGQRPRQIGSGLGRVDFTVDGPELKAGLRDARALFLHFGIAAGKGQSLFNGPQVDVGCGCLGDQHYQHVIVILDGAVQTRIRRLHGSPEPPPEVEFPGQAASQPIVAEGAQPTAALS